MSDKPVDTKCHELADHFLSDVKGSRGEDRQELAEAIQSLCEDFCREVESDEANKALMP